MSAPAYAGDWIARRPPAHPVTRRIFALAHAGGGASTYFGWPAALAPHGIDLVPLQLPGRENRFSDPPIADLDRLVTALRAAVEPLLDLPFAIFGHSMGGLVGFELARVLSVGGREPCHLFVSGARAPQQTRTTDSLHGRDDEALLRGVAERYGGVPAQVFASADLRAIVVPALRADLTIVERYAFVAGPPLACAIDVLRGEDDPVVRREEVEGWREVTRGAVRTVTFAGDHFYLRSGAAAVQRHLALAFERG